MKIAVIGTGYVGLVTGTCFAESGNDVICVDKDVRKVQMLEGGQIPIYLKHNPGAAAGLLRILAYTPPFGAAAGTWNGAGMEIISSGLPRAQPWG